MTKKELYEKLGLIGYIFREYNVFREKTWIDKQIDKDVWILSKKSRNRCGIYCKIDFLNKKVIKTKELYKTIMCNEILYSRSLKLNNFEKEIFNQFGWNHLTNYVVSKNINIPQKVLILGIEKYKNGERISYIEDYICPKCNLSLDEYCNYCNECGKALDWSGDNE